MYLLTSMVHILVSTGLAILAFYSLRNSRGIETSQKEVLAKIFRNTSLVYVHIPLNSNLSLAIVTKALDHSVLLISIPRLVPISLRSPDYHLLASNLELGVTMMLCKHNAERHLNTTN